MPTLPGIFPKVICSAVWRCPFTFVGGSLGPSPQREGTKSSKRKATHASQNPEGMCRRHDQMNRFHSAEYRCEFAEAFVRHVHHEFRF